MYNKNSKLTKEEELIKTCKLVVDIMFNVHTYQMNGILILFP